VSFRALCLTTALWTAGPTVTVLAAEWHVVDVDGLAVWLVDGEWREIARSDLLNDPVLRTLSRTHITLGLGGTIVELGPDAAASFGQTSRAGPTIEQYAGSMSVRGTSAAGMTIAAGRMTITNFSGAIAVAVSDATAALVLQSGGASVRLDKGTAVRLKGGQMVSTGSRALIVQPVGLTTSVEAATELVETALENSSKANNGNGGNASGNKGGNGNGGGHGNGGGNSNSNGNGGGQGNDIESGGSNDNGNGKKAPK
jgi:hypothetical protein